MPGTVSGLRWVVGGAVIVALTAVYALIDPSTHFFPRCIFLQLTGYQCPGCGSQRAVHALLHGHIAEAWHFNALLVASIPFLVMMFTAQAFKHRFPRLHNSVNSLTAVVIWAVVIAGWWIFRNIWL